MSSAAPRSALTPEDVRKVSPALEHYTRNSIEEGLCKRPDLSARDRSVVTVSALIAGNQTIGMLHYFNIALDNGVTPAELSEIITHLAFYSGWSNAFFAVAIVKDIFEQRGIGTDQLPPVSPALLPLNEAAEAERAARVQQDIGHVAPGVVHYTTDLLFRDLWLRPALAPRDRSVVTVSFAIGRVDRVRLYRLAARDVVVISGAGVLRRSPGLASGIPAWPFLHGPRFRRVAAECGLGAIRLARTHDPGPSQSRRRAERGIVCARDLSTFFVTRSPCAPGQPAPVRTWPSLSRDLSILVCSRYAIP